MSRILRSDMTPDEKVAFYAARIHRTALARIKKFGPTKTFPDGRALLRRVDALLLDREKEPA